MEERRASLAFLSIYVDVAELKEIVSVLFSLTLYIHIIHINNPKAIIDPQFHFFSEQIHFTYIIAARQTHLNSRLHTYTFSLPCTRPSFSIRSLLDIPFHRAHAIFALARIFAIERRRLFFFLPVFYSSISNFKRYYSSFREFSAACAQIYICCLESSQ